LRGVEVFSDVVDLNKLTEPSRSTIAWFIQQAENDPAASFSRAQCMDFFGHGLSKQLEIEASGELVVFMDGGKRRIEKRSAYLRLIRLIIESNPPDAPVPKREVKTRFRKKIRPRTAAELEGLAKANEARRLEAQARRAAAEETKV
jgi:hypothetical protein